MKRILIAAALLAPVAALAQSSPQQQADPQIQALSQTVVALTGETVSLRAQVIAAQAHAADLQKQLDAAKAAEKKPAK